MSSSDGLRVLGVGWPRTGTTTLRRALVQLGFGPCDHMMELSATPSRVARWEDLEHGLPGAAHALFDGWRAAVDNPTCSFWRELFEGARPDGDLGRVVDLLRRRWVDGMLRGAPRDRDECMRAFAAHVHDVRAAVGDRLLVMEPSDGWEPLCAHLGVRVPDVPWPHANTRAFVARHGVHEA